jgi:hypothetical protein
MDQSGLMDSTGKILFVCPACGYRARIPGNYLGMAIRCPGCNGAQTVVKPEKSESTGKTVSITKIATTPVPFTMEEARKPYAAQPPAAPAASAARAGAIRTPLPGSLDVASPPAVAQDRALPSGAGQSLAFTCTVCAYRARIPMSYAGRTILCPSCKATQLAPSVATPAATGNTAVIARVITASPATGSPVLGERVAKPSVSTPQVELSEKILVSCMACGLRARLPSKYAGQTIKCPKCAKPLTVPLSEAVEEATGRTVTIARADLARSGEPEAPKGEAPAKPDAGGPKPLALPSKRPSGEITMPAPSRKAVGDELMLDLGPAAAMHPGPPATPPTVPVVPPSEAGDKPDPDEDLDLSGRNQQLTPPKKGGVVRRRGGVSSRMATPAAGTPAEERGATPPPERSDAISPTDIALKTTEDPDSDEARAARPAVRASAPESGVKKPRPVQTTPAPGRSATPPPEPVAPARRPAPAPPPSAGMPAARHMHWPLLGLLFAAVVACVLLGWRWNTANQQVAELTVRNSDLDQKKQQLTKQTTDDARKLLDLGNDLDKAKKQGDDEQARIDTLEKDSATMKTQMQSQQTDMQKTIDDLKTQLDELKRRLEAATDSKPAPVSPKK